METRQVITLAQIALGIMALVFWCGYFYSAWRMICGRKEGVSLFGRQVLWNPFNICFRPSLLTDAGLQARRWFFICICGFPLSILGIIALSSLLPHS
jgi:hypothetical protein